MFNFVFVFHHPLTLIRFYFVACEVNFLSYLFFNLSLVFTCKPSLIFFLLFFTLPDSSLLLDNFFFLFNFSLASICLLFCEFMWIWGELFNCLAVVVKTPPWRNFPWDRQYKWNKLHLLRKRSGPKNCLETDANYYAQLQAKYEEYTRRNGFLIIPEVLDDVNTKKISLLTTWRKNS